MSKIDEVILASRKSIGTNIRHEMEHRLITVEKLSDMTDLPRKLIRGILDGSVEYTINELLMITGVLKMEVKIKRDIVELVLQ